MTNNQLNRERLAKIKSWRETYGAGSNVMLPAEEAEELARIALAAMNGEPFAYIIQDKYERERGVEGHLSRSHVSKYVSQEDINEHEITCIPLYRHAQPVPVVEREPIALAAMDSEPYGFTDGDRRGMIYKPEHSDRLSEPVPVYRHAQPAPVVLDGLIKAVEFYEQVKRENPPVETGAWKDAVDWVMKEACRAAMLQAQSDDDGEPTDDERIMAIEGIHNCERCGDEGWMVGEMGITRCACGQADNSPVFPGAEQRIADAVELLKKAAPAMLADNGDPDGPLAGRMKSPVIPDGYVMVPMRLTAENGAKGALSGEFS